LGALEPRFEFRLGKPARRDCFRRIPLVVHLPSFRFVEIYVRDQCGS
jgi:hypothetical protein